jgi:hypothetical protein
MIIRSDETERDSRLEIRGGWCIKEYNLFVSIGTFVCVCVCVCVCVRMCALLLLRDPSAGIFL